MAFSSPFEFLYYYKSHDRKKRFSVVGFFCRMNFCFICINIVIYPHKFISIACCIILLTNFFTFLPDF